MAAVHEARADVPRAGAHAAWVRVAHWIVAASVFTLVFSGVEILMVHPRLYWGEVGNDLTPALLELPISRNHQHGGWTPPQSFSPSGAGPISASRTFDIFNQNGWGRSLHFLAAWCLVVPGVLYLLAGLTGGHFRAHVWPRRDELTSRRLRADVGDHLRLRLAPATGGPDYGSLQKLAYTAVVFVFAPLVALTGLTMSPAVTASFPFLLALFGGYQTARTIHFVLFVTLALFVLVHIAMIALTGFRRHMRSMTLGR